MSSFFVDTEKLSERYEKGTGLERQIHEDLEALRVDIDVICGKLEERGENDRVDAVRGLFEEIDKTVRNITAISRFDELAIKKYNRLLMKVNDIVSAIKI